MTIDQLVPTIMLCLGLCFAVPIIGIGLYLKFKDGCCGVAKVPKKRKSKKTWHKRKRDKDSLL